MYSIADLIYCLNKRESVSGSCPHVDVAMARRDEIRWEVFWKMIDMCLKKGYLGSSVRPSLFVYLSVGIGWLLRERKYSKLYSAGSGVNSVAVDLGGAMSRQFRFDQF